jgi:hypothetical protein
MWLAVGCILIQQPELVVSCRASLVRVRKPELVLMTWLGSLRWAAQTRNVPSTILLQLPEAETSFEPARWHQPVPCVSSRWGDHLAEQCDYGRHTPGELLRDSALTSLLLVRGVTSSSVLILCEHVGAMAFCA